MFNVSPYNLNSYYAQVPYPFFKYIVFKYIVYQITQTPTHQSKPFCSIAVMSMIDVNWPAENVLLCLCFAAKVSNKLFNHLDPHYTLIS